MSTVSKVLECPDHSQISNFLEDKNLLSESRFGFSPQTVRLLRLFSRSGGPKTFIFSCSSLSVPLFYQLLWARFTTNRHETMYTLLLFKLSFPKKSKTIYGSTICKHFNTSIRVIF